ncbi:hypothetical protein N781_12200 [Pontibacillus halophilus JSM 076056 = DSM 19796]|uniref:Flagellar hook-length control protein-like C-terminal domain-containing protein n=1 Tax=Pontibacillus halophilus JSM 076056 = DSM 19796 TaxID=1385510 RepID=A0A0A5GJ91_9BACI|nr:flagellar hook-length control protein FliK [Pontibacillus halophilus]KGX93326.1 hypothetical protein N781_12200 [Pontibacillus halophilus JSM 076056 = DSM 19796]
MNAITAIIATGNTPNRVLPVQQQGETSSFGNRFNSLLEGMPKGEKGSMETVLKDLVGVLQSLSPEALEKVQNLLQGNMEGMGDHAKKLLSLFQSLPNPIVQQLNQLTQATSERSSSFELSLMDGERIELSSEDVTSLQQFLAGLERLVRGEDVLENMPAMNISNLEHLGQVAIQPLTSIDMHASKEVKLTDLINQAKDLLASLKDQGSLNVKERQQLLHVMKDLAAIMKQQMGGSETTDGKGSFSIILKEHGMTSKEAKVIEQTLFTLVSKETMSKGYVTESVVTGKDIGKWMKAVLQQETTSATQLSWSQQGQATSAAMPMSQVEQFVLHTNSPNQAGQAPSNSQLFEKFQQLISSSQFTKGLHGGKELSIVLRPDHLGSMNVKLTQMNGEMMVKILVTSQASKEMLEGNIQQLRHLFSPNQVVIEKQDVLNFSQQEAEHEQREQGKQEQQHHSPHSHEEEREDSSSTSFEEILNEQV